MAAQNEEMLTRELNNIRVSLKKLAPLFNDPSLTDIYVSDAGDVSIKRFGEPISDTTINLTRNERLQILNQIAKYQETIINFNEYPVLEGTIPISEYESRITGIYPPYSNEPNFTIRRPPKMIFTLEKYVEKKQLTEERYELIVSYIKNRKNIVVSGGTGTGKTTFLNAVINKKSEIYPQDRFYIVQDISELQCNAKYIVWVYTQPQQAAKAVQLSLRQSPDSIIFGEVRNGEVMLQLLDAWNTGHPGGITSIHANDTHSTLLRVKSLLSQAYKGEPPSIADISKQIDLIIHLSKNLQTGIIVDDVFELQKKL